jgi:hypothetical protein
MPQHKRDQHDDAQSDQACSSLLVSSSGILPSKRNCNHVDEGTAHARSERILLMNTDILAEKHFEMETQVQATRLETDMLAQCGLSAEEIVAVVWLRQWYQTGGSDRVQIMRHLEYLRFLVLHGKMTL